jgi:hypothetical protein
VHTYLLSLRGSAIKSAWGERYSLHRITVGNFRNNQYAIFSISSSATVSFAPIVETGGACRFMTGHLLGDFELPAILQKCRDAGGPKTMTGKFCLDAGRECVPADHLVHILLR